MKTPVTHIKMNLEERMIKLTPIEESQTEDILVNSFLEHAPEIESSVTIAHTASK